MGPPAAAKRGKNGIDAESCYNYQSTFWLSPLVPRLQGRNWNLPNSPWVSLLFISNNNCAPRFAEMTVHTYGDRDYFINRGSLHVRAGHRGCHPHGSSETILQTIIVLHNLRGWSHTQTLGLGLFYSHKTHASHVRARSSRVSFVRIEWHYSSNNTPINYVKKDI